MKLFADPLLEIAQYRELKAMFGDRPRSPEGDAASEHLPKASVAGLSESQKAHFACSLCMHTGAKILFITYNEAQAKKTYEDFSFFMGERAVFVPYVEIMPYDIEARSREALHRKTTALDRIIRGDFAAAVTSVEAASQYLPPPGVFAENVVEITEGDRIIIDELAMRLTEAGYERTALVEARGQFAVRGGILDVFAADSTYPARIEFFGDETDSLRLFDAVTQRSVDTVRSIRIIPARDVICPVSERSRIAAAIRAELEELERVWSRGGRAPGREHEHEHEHESGRLHKREPGHGPEPEPGHEHERVPEAIKNEIRKTAARDIGLFENRGYFPGMDRYIRYVIEKPASLIDYFTWGEKEEKRGLIFADEPARMEQRAENAALEYYEICRGLLEKGRVLPSCALAFPEKEKVIPDIFSASRIYMHAIPPGTSGNKHGKLFDFKAKQLSSYERHVDMLIGDVAQWKQDGKKIIILSGSSGRGRRFCEELQYNGIEAAYFGEADAGQTGTIAGGQVAVLPGTLHRGFEYPDSGAGFVLVNDSWTIRHEAQGYKPSGKMREAWGDEAGEAADHDHTAAWKIRGGAGKGGTGREGSRRKSVSSRISTFTELKAGDHIVHYSHGIGIYEGITQLEVEGIKKDYIKIRYLDGAYIYVPVNQLDLIQKYIGHEGRTPKLSRLGGGDWAKARARVKESLKKIAGELIRLYAERKAAGGFAFQPDSIWQRQFEDLFIYEPTDDQLRCVDEIKADMEKEEPMDRLLCGDVGFGKTEVAVRAMFKAVLSGRQVAYLVPTTILAQQQYESISARTADFPVKVDVISRFRSPREQKEIVKGTGEGTIDILIGTHRLIQKDIRFKNLGLLVVDEEHRFGVANKEKIKKMKPDIDVLTLTATPIPRTLHMSLTGIRDISTIEDPPEDRYPVTTFVMEYDPAVARDAIARELSRNGQVFYLYNRVRTIQAKAAELQRDMPEARVAFAHGQMDEKQLEDIMFNFVGGRYDVLVCTTIIESGLDMPNVNTIIVEDAEKMGLAQLYQLRGRVGRSNRAAYAYIMHRKDRILTEASEKRLQAIREFTELGSGFRIAMRDLEIRGTGNLLGAEQHGHLESVGYDMYCRLLDEAVRELKAENRMAASAVSAASASSAAAGTETAGPATAPDEADAGETPAEDTLVDFAVSAYLDDSYIENPTAKIQMYKRIAAIRNEEDASDVCDEMTDRYGDMSLEAQHLVQIALIKALASSCGFSVIKGQKGAREAAAVQFCYRENKEINFGMLSALMEKYRGQLLFSAGRTPYISYRTNAGDMAEVLRNIKILLQDALELQDNA